MGFNVGDSINVLVGEDYKDGYVIKSYNDMCLVVYYGKTYAITDIFPLSSIVAR